MSNDVSSKACGHADCGVSTGICEALTFGRGKLDSNGYWSIPCGPCARDHARRNPGAFVWPYPAAPAPASMEWKVGDYAVLRNFHPPLVARLTHKIDSSGAWYVDAGFGGLASAITAYESQMGRVPDDPPPGGWSSAAEEWRERECGCPKPRRLTQVGACWTCGDQILYRPQRIEGPAIRDPRGVVYTLPTPASHYAVAQAITTWKPDATPLKWDQGFVTETGRYVDRREGKRIAEEAGQLVRPIAGGDRLFSEELWGNKEGCES